MGRLINRIFDFVSKIQCKVNVDKEIVESLQSKGASITEIEDEIRRCLGQFDYEFNDDNRDSRHKIKSIELEKSLKYLDKILYISLGKIISIAINESMVGNEYEYILKSYEINAIDNSVYLKLERKEDKYKLFLNRIYTIKCNGNKVWIYMEGKDWRFFHTITDIMIENLGEDFRSEYIELREDRKIYLQYENTDKAKYLAERFKYTYRNAKVLITEKYAADKKGNKLIFINIFDKDSNYKKSGSIYAFSEYADEGKFYYELKSDCLYIDDMLPRRQSMGVGSEALKFIEEIAKDNGKTKIRGMLSSNDFDHKSRLLHFYEKNGYKINKTETGIEKILE